MGPAQIVLIYWFYRLSGQRDASFISGLLREDKFVKMYGGDSGSATLYRSE